MRARSASTSASSSRSRSVTSTAMRLAGGRLLLLKEREHGDAGRVDGHGLGGELDDAARRVGAVGEDDDRALVPAAEQVQRGQNFVGGVEPGVDERDLEARAGAQLG